MKKETPRDASERRRYFRLRYPVDQRPTLRIDDVTYALAEVSEYGLRFCDPGDFNAPEGPIRAELVFRDGHVVVVDEAVILRSQGKTGREVVLLTNGEVTFHRMMVEQRGVVQACRTAGQPAELKWLRARIARVEGTQPA